MTLRRRLRRCYLRAKKRLTAWLGSLMDWRLS
jgi:hypothetical protein